MLAVAKYEFRGFQYRTTAIYLFRKTVQALKIVFFFLLDYLLFVSFCIIVCLEIHM